MSSSFPAEAPGLVDEVRRAHLVLQRALVALGSILAEIVDDAPHLLDREDVAEALEAVMAS